MNVMNKINYKLILQIGMKIGIAFFAITGIVAVVSGGGVEAFSLKRMLFFTVQSNLAILLMTLIFLGFILRQVIAGKGGINPAWLLPKYIFTVAITVTFLVYWLVIAPKMHPIYVYTYASFSVHLFVPLLAIADFYLWDYRVDVGKKKWLLGMFPMLCYLAFALIASACGVIFPSGKQVPYLFLDYEKLTWFSFDHGIGVFYIILLLSAFCVGLNALMAFFVKKRKRYAAKSNPSKTTS